MSPTTGQGPQNATTRARGLILTIIRAFLIVALMVGITFIWVAIGPDLTYAYPQDSGLVLWYDLDEGAGTVAGDLSGYDNNGTLYGSTWMSGANCMAGGCINFTGASNSQISNISHSASLNITGQFTASLSIQPYVTGTFGELLDFRDSSNGWHIALIANGTIRIGVLTAPTVFVWSTGALTNGTWYTLTTGWNGTDIYLYINNVFNASAPRTTNLTEMTQHKQIASFENFNFYKGAIHCISLYNRTLNSTERATNSCTFAAGGGGDTPPPTLSVQSPTNTTYPPPLAWAHVTLNQDTG